MQNVLCVQRGVPTHVNFYNRLAIVLQHFLQPQKFQASLDVIPLYLYEISYVGFVLDKEHLLSWQTQSINSFLIHMIWNLDLKQLVDSSIC